jgi:hypothetical protein
MAGGSAWSGPLPTCRAARYSLSTTRPRATGSRSAPETAVPRDGAGGCRSGGTARAQRGHGRTALAAVLVSRRPQIRPFGPGHAAVNVREGAARAASRAEDLTTFLNGSTLRDVWRDLFLPRDVRRAWEDRHPVLRGLQLSRPERVPHKDEARGSRQRAARTVADLARFARPPPG